MKIRTDYDGCQYITAGKVYEATPAEYGLFRITDDDGDSILAEIGKSLHLHNHRFEVVEEEEELVKVYVSGQFAFDASTNKPIGIVIGDEGYTEEIVENDCYCYKIDQSPFSQEADTRKTYPVYSGVVKYFPDALAEISHVSWEGNEQHHPGTPLHWDRAKSQDELDALMRHLIDYAKHGNKEELAKVCWRSLAMLQKVCEGEEA